jgi:transducin (beta)-like 1
VLNKGLLYHASERESARVCIIVEEKANPQSHQPKTDRFSQTTRDVVGPVRGFFGPVTAVPRPAAVDEDDVENVRKRQLGDDETPIQNGPSGKRPRLSNGYENGFDAMSKSPISLAIEVAMDVDEEQQQHGNGNAYPSPEQVPSPVIATNGPTIGTQIDKVAQLETETTFLDLSDDSRMTVLLHCEFNPRDPTILAATGTDALARMWTLSRTAPDLNSADKMQIDSPVFPPYLNLLDEGAPATTSVTGLSWSSDGNIIAVASEPLEEGNVKINLWNLEGVSVASFLEIESPVIILRWNLSNTLLLALSPKSAIGGAVITVMSPASQETIQYPLPSHSLFDQPLDAAWTGDEEFVLCGGDVLQAFQYAESEISPLRKYETREGHALSKVIYDWRSRLLVTAGDTGMIDVSIFIQPIRLYSHIYRSGTSKDNVVHFLPTRD